MEPAKKAWLLVALLGVFGCGPREGLSNEEPNGRDAGPPDATPDATPTAAPDSGDEAAAMGDDGGCTSAVATTTVAVVANLSADATPPAQAWSPADVAAGSTFAVMANVYDSLGRSHATTVFFADTAIGSWAYHVVAQGAEVAGGTPGSLVEFASGTLAFDVDGALSSVTAHGGTIVFEGAEPSTLDYRLELTQYGGPNMVLAQSADGVPCGAGDDAGTIACGGARATTSIGLAGNFNANDAPPADAWNPLRAASTSNFSTSFVVYDSLGVVHPIHAFFVDQGPSVWTYRLVANGTEVAGSTTNDPVEFGSGMLSFQADGSLASAARSGGSVMFAGAAAQDVALDASALTCLPEPSLVMASSQDGRAACGALVGASTYACSAVTPSTQVSLTMNLDANSYPPSGPWDPEQPDATSTLGDSIEVVDSLGRWHWLGIYFAAEGDGYWGYHVLTRAGETLANPPGPNVEILSGELLFTVDGALQSNEPAGPGTVQYAGAEAQSLALDVGTPIDQGGSGFEKSTSFQSATTVSAQLQDGHVYCAP